MINEENIRNKYSPEMGLVIIICRVYFNTAPPKHINEYIRINTINWELFYRIISAHQIRPIIYKGLSEIPELTEIAIVEKLKKNCFDIAIQNIIRLKELVRVCELFDRHAVNVIPYKGVLLSRRLYNDYVTRETCDIDLLISREDFSRIRILLLDDGYDTDYYYNEELEYVLLDSGCEYMFYKIVDGIKIKIEIHWSIIHQMQDVLLENAALFAQMGKENVLEKDVNTLSLEDDLLVMLVHHGVNDVWRTLRHVIDLATFCMKYQDTIDLNSFQKRIEMYKVRNASMTGFLLSEQLFGVRIPDLTSDWPVMNKIVDNLLTFPMITRHKLSLVNFRQQLALRDSFIDKWILCLKYLKAGITPNIRDVESFPMSKKLFFLYYLIKPFRILKNGFN